MYMHLKIGALSNWAGALFNLAHMENELRLSFMQGGFKNLFLSL